MSTTHHPVTVTVSVIESARRGVLLAYSDPYGGELVEREFYVRGPYVYERTDSRSDPQVCAGLSRSGSTLMASEESLPAVIRKHALRYVRAGNR